MDKIIFLLLISKQINTYKTIFVSLNKVKSDFKLSTTKSDSKYDSTFETEQI